MKNVLIVFGSMTPEHALSCKSASTILESIDREKFNPIAVGITREGQWFYTEAAPEEILGAEAWLESPTNRPATMNVSHGAKELLVFEEDGSVARYPIDVVFARIAGNTGEDGKLQGLWELCGIPYVGCGVMSSACSMDKAISYLFAESIGMRCPKTYVAFRSDFQADKQAMLDAIQETLIDPCGYPVFVKPVDTGSSIGISRVAQPEEMLPALESAFGFSSKLVLEEGITGTEIKVGMLGNEDPEIGAICQLKAEGDWNDFETKYTTHTSNKQIPALLAPEVEEDIKMWARKVYQVLDCRGFSRIDFFLTPENEVVFNEINSMPGFHPHSVYPELFAAAGVSYTELITRLLELAME